MAGATASGIQMTRAAAALCGIQSTSAPLASSPSRICEVPISVSSSSFSCGIQKKLQSSSILPSTLPFTGRNMSSTVSVNSNRKPTQPVASASDDGASSGLSIDLRGKRAFIAGIPDDNGYGWAVPKSLAAAAAEDVVGTWVLGKNNFLLEDVQQLEEKSVSMWTKPNVQRKTKIVCTIGPSTSTREMIWKLAEAGMNVARLNMSHGDHASHKKVIDLVKEYNAQSADNVIAIMLDTKGPEVRSGDLPQPILLSKGQVFTFTIKRGVGAGDCVSVNYDGFVNDVEKGDTLLVDGGMMSLVVKSKTLDSVVCEVIDGGELKSRRHLNVRGKSATLPSITDKDWEDIKFGVENKVDFYAVSFVKDAKVVHELKDYLKSCGADIHVTVKIESADSIPNLHSIISASDGAMVARGDLGAELPIEDVPLLQEEIIRTCHSMGKPVIVATNMLESMINHPTPTRAEVSDIAIAVREGADAIMLSGETAHGKYPLKAVKVMHTVALRTEATRLDEERPANLGRAFKNHMSEMFAFHATMMSNTLGTSIVVFTRTGFMATLLSHYRPSGTIFAFTNEERVKQRLALYQGIRPIYIPFSDDAEETFLKALSLLQVWVHAIVLVPKASFLFELVVSWVRKSGATNSTKKNKVCSGPLIRWCRFKPRNCTCCNELSHACLHSAFGSKSIFGAFRLCPRLLQGRSGLPCIYWNLYGECIDQKALGVLQDL